MKYNARYKVFLHHHWLVGCFSKYSHNIYHSKGLSLLIIPLIIRDHDVFKIFKTENYKNIYISVKTRFQQCCTCIYVCIYLPSLKNIIKIYNTI